MQISDAQSRAIAHGNGPAMVLAGPGSGKTLVITKRTQYLIEEYGVSPSQILVITFTKAAAQEMRQRFCAACNRSGVTFGTFHAVFFAILKAAYHFTNANILTEDKKYQILLNLIREEHLSTNEEKELLSDITAEISLVKNEQVDLSYYYSKSCPQEAFRRIFSKYEKIHKEMGLLDFDDMLVYTYQLLKERPDILALWQQRFKYILVDEFQDINLLQFQIVKMLALPENNLFIVGDDDQSIYRFRGAKPEIMLNFTKHYPNAVTILLDQNFRCSSTIVQNAGKVIRENVNRFSKEIQSVREDGEPLDIQDFESQDHESLYLIRCIQESLKNGISRNEIAVLFRTNQGAGPFAQRMMEFNIPFVMRDTLPDIYEHWVAKDIITYMRLAMEGLDREGFLQIMNRPKRYLSRDSVQSDPVTIQGLMDYYREKDWMQDRIDRFAFDMNIMKEMTPYAAINYIRNGIHYEEYLEEYTKERHMKLEELTDILDEIQQSAKPYKTYWEWKQHLEDYKERMMELKRHKPQEDAITFATLHSSKGLEFREVFIVDVNEQIIPHKKAVLEADIEEERRLFYVGMTRAKDLLHLFYIKERYGKQMNASEFMNCLFTQED